jgi:hypothetical protein
MSHRAPPSNVFAPTFFRTPEDQAVLDAADEYVRGPADGHKAQRRHRLQKAVLERWWSKQSSPLAKRRAAILSSAGAADLRAKGNRPSPEAP